MLTSDVKRSSSASRAKNIGPTIPGVIPQLVSEHLVEVLVKCKRSHPWEQREALLDVEGSLVPRTMLAEGKIVIDVGNGHKSKRRTVKNIVT